MHINCKYLYVILCIDVKTTIPKWFVPFSLVMYVCDFLCSVDNQYKNQGKLGAAVLANHATTDVSAIKPG